MQKVRIKYSKTGLSKYISHLELVRIVTRAIKRADIPIVYSQGFNPSPRLNFTLPLSLGQESECEFMNLKVDPDMQPEEIRSRLSVQLPDGIRLIEAYCSDDLRDEACYARYIISLDEDLQTSVNECFSKEEIVVNKRTKSGEKLTDIKPYIRSICANTDGGKTEIECILCTKDPNFLNPSYIVTALSDYIGKDIKSRRILRTQVLTDDLEIFR